MAFGHALRSLAIYDLLTNLIPGAVFLSAVGVMLLPLYSVGDCHQK